MLRIKSTSLDLDEETSVPLKKVNVNAKIHSFGADVTITQIFRNDETKAIEAVYCFPIEEKAAIYSFHARIDDREISAQLKEKQEAQQDYSNALQQGHGAYLFEQDENSQDNFIINVGALPPSKECTIMISYVTELEFVQGSTIRFVIPTTIAPRYNPNKQSIASPAGTTSNYVQTTPYTIEFRCSIDKLDQYITQVNSPSHPIQIDFSQEDSYVITLSQETTHLDRDILLNIELSSKRTNTIIAVEPHAVMAVFTPTEENSPEEFNANQINEFIFIIDCSGSMEDENKIGLARQAMLLFLKSLPMDSYFNIIRFGSNYRSLFPEITVVYNQTNAQKAEQLINSMKADLGGTELLSPLQWLQKDSPRENRARQVFLLTDGEISNVTEVLDLCRSMSTSTRIFSFGLGKSPSRSLVKGLARSTNGRFVFISPNSNVDTYVGQQLQYALQPCITNLDVQWNLGIPVQSAPKELPPVYFNDRLIVYALIDDQTIPFDHNSTVILKDKSTDRLVTTANIDRIPNIVENATIARLAAKALILELQHSKTLSSSDETPQLGSTQARFQNLTTSNDESIQTVTDKQTTKQRIIELSIKYHILSPYTAFIGIEKRTNTNNDEMVLREVPIQISADDQHLQKSLGGKRYRHSVRAAQAPILVTASHLYRESSSPFVSCSIPLVDSNRYCRYQKLAALETCQMRSPILMRSQSRRRIRSRSRSPVRDRSKRTLEVEDKCSINDADIVRDLIKKQEYDGLWNLNDDDIAKLTGKSISSFRSIDKDIDKQIINSIIIVLLLETRFATYSSLWHGIVQKARKQINTLVTRDSKNVNTLIEDIRQRL
ncbi:hypothetical protein I4U23_027784 [Adineta vaga]|nr:hypothetical protein I4U23_027784 [Adineta vaga]